MFGSVFRVATLTLMLVMTLLALETKSGLCQENENLGLKLAPQSTSFYASSINHDKLLMRMLNSNAWNNLAGHEGPRQYLAVLQGVSQAFDPQAMFGLEGDESALAAFLVDPDNSKAVQTLGLQLVSSEVFLFGDENWSRLVELFRSAMMQSILLAEEKGVRFDGLTSGLTEIEMVKIYTDLLSDEFSNLQLPGMVMGGRIQDQELANKLIQQLDPIVREDLATLPDSMDFLKSGYSLVVDDDRSLLTFRFKVAELPWEELDEQISEVEVNPEVLELIRNGVGDREIVLAIGTVGDHFVFAYGGGEDFEKQLGTGPSLQDVAELEPLAEYLDRELTSVHYVSEQMASSSIGSAYGDGAGYGLKKAVEELLSHEGYEIDEETTSLMEDVIDEAAGLFPKKGATLRFSFLTEDTIEGFQYDYGEVIYLDGTKPLDITNHIGGEPAMVYASRLKNREQVLGVLDAIKTLSESFEGKIETGARHESERLLRGFLEVAGEKLLPATRDGQMAIVLDFHGSTFPPLAPSESPLEVKTPEFAMLMGITDRDVFLESMEDLWKLFDGPAIAENIDDVEIVTNELDDAILFSMDMGKELSDLGFQPSFLVTDELAAITLSEGHAMRIQEVHPLKLISEKLDVTQPACQLFHYDNALVVEAVEGWGTIAVQFYLSMTGAEMDQEIQVSVGHLVDFLKAYKGYSSITRENGNGLLTRFIYRFEDSK